MSALVKQNYYLNKIIALNGDVTNKIHKIKRNKAVLLYLNSVKSRKVNHSGWGWKRDPLNPTSLLNIRT